MAFGELNLNYDPNTGGVFYKDSAGNLKKVGPAEVSATAPNVSPVGSSGNSLGELWYDTSASALKLWDGSSWASVGGGSGGTSTTNSQARLWWDNNATATDILAINQWVVMASATRGLGPLSNEFALSPTNATLTFTGGVTKRFRISAFGRWTTAAVRVISTGIARKDSSGGGGINPNLDALADSFNTVSPGSTSVIFISESIINVNPGDIVYPIVRNTTDNLDVIIRNLSFTAMEV